MAAHFAIDFDKVRPLFNGKLSQKQVDGINLIVDRYRGISLPMLAYILATAKWETAHTMQPIREYGRGRGRPYGKIDSTGKAPYGRGYVQLTWEYNYKKADVNLQLGGKLAADYDLALDPDIAVRILIRGMEEGWFTGKKLSDYLGDSATRADYKHARRVVNGTDKDDEIAAIAMSFAAALTPVKFTSVPKPPATVEDAPDSGPVVTGFWATLIKAIMALFGRK